MSTPEQELDAVMGEQMRRGHLPGLAACVVKHGQVAWCKGYGVANLEEQRPVTEDTVFPVASISKTVTATVLMQLWEQSLFELDDNVDELAPFSVVHPVYRAPITYRGLLSHTASVRDNWAVLDQLTVYDADPAMTLAECMSGYFDPAGIWRCPIVGPAARTSLKAITRSAIIPTRPCVRAPPI